jgi:hypothetical protein
MMEEQIQMLSKLITQREQNSQPAASSRPADEVMGESAEAPVELEADTGAHTTAESHTEAATMVESNGAQTAGADASKSTAAPNKIMSTSKSTTAPIETADYSPDISMDGAEGMSTNATAGSETEIGNTNKGTVVPTETAAASASKRRSVPISIIHTQKGLVQRINLEEYYPNVSFDGTEDPSSTDSEMETPDRMLEAQE